MTAAGPVKQNHFESRVIYQEGLLMPRWVWLVGAMALRAAAVAASAPALVTVVRRPEGLRVLPGWGGAKDWVVRANLTDTEQATGWLRLSVESNPGRSNAEQAEAAGLAEGWLTRDLVHSYYLEFIHRDLCGVSADFCRWVRALLERQRAWQDAQMGGDDAYWEQVGLFDTQLDGLRSGWLARTQEDGFEASPDFDTLWFAHFINFLPDISDYIRQYVAEVAARPGVALRTAAGGLLPLRAALPSCSVLVRRLPATGKLLVGHATWHDYRALGYRVLKHYRLPYSLPGGGRVPGHTLAMSSYAGTLYSLDDFYLLSSGLVTTESTLFVYKEELYVTNRPEGSVWEPVRAMVANRLARRASDWGAIFGRHNSGTYNNQWLAVEPGTGRLWATEQLPGSVVSREVTDRLQAAGYWASYNRAAFNATISASGAAAMVEEHGEWFSHDDTPRAKLFERGAAGATDAWSLLALLRWEKMPARRHLHLQDQQLHGLGAGPAGRLLGAAAPGGAGGEGGPAGAAARTGVSVLRPGTSPAPGSRKTSWLGGGRTGPSMPR
jgi:hypothetical protein